jgi:hypothetical protein
MADKCQIRILKFVWLKYFQFRQIFNEDFWFKGFILRITFQWNDFDGWRKSQFVENEMRRANCWNREN